MKKEIYITGENNYVYEIDEVQSIVVKNKLGQSFVFEIDEIKDIKLNHSNQ